MPPRLEAEINPELLVWARKSVRMSLDTAAKKISVKPEKLREWESGESRPTVNQLWKCADVYKRPLAAFFLPEAPPLPERIHDFRRITGDVDESASSQLEIEIRRARLSRENTLELARKLGEEIPRFVLRARTDASPERVGSDAREALGIDLRHQEEWRDSYQALRQWIRAVESLGILVLQCSRIPSEVMRGFSLSVEPLPVVLLNGGETPNGRIFTLMHELAHLMIGNGGVCDTVEYRGDESTDQRVERFCNRFAASLLVPEDAFLRDVNMTTRRTKEWLDSTISSLAEKYRVSREVILGRLYHFELVTSSVYDRHLRRLRDEFLAIRRRRRGGGGDFYKTKVRNNGLSYTRVVLEAHSQGVIGLGDVCDLLNVKVRHVDRIQRELRRVG